MQTLLTEPAEVAHADAHSGPRARVLGGMLNVGQKRAGQDQRTSHQHLGPVPAQLSQELDMADVLRLWDSLLSAGLRAG